MQPRAYCISALPTRQQVPDGPAVLTFFPPSLAVFNTPAALPQPPRAGTIKKVVSPAIWPIGFRCGKVRNDNRQWERASRAKSPRQLMNEARTVRQGLALRAHRARQNNPLQIREILDALRLPLAGGQPPFRELRLAGVDLSEFWRCERAASAIRKWRDLRGLSI